jgi:hypothetical protein
VSEPGFHTAFTDHGGNTSSADANCSHLGGGQSLGTDIENGQSDMVDPGMTGYGTGLLTNGPFYDFQGPRLSAFANNTQHYGYFSSHNIEPPHSIYCAYIQRHIEMEKRALRQQVCNLERWKRNFNGRPFFSLFFVASANQDFCDLALGRHSTRRRWSVGAMLKESFILGTDHC